MAKELLIEELVRNLQPRTAIEKPEIRVWKLLILGLGIATLILYFTGKRSAIESDLVLNYFFGEIILLVGLLAFAIDSVLKSVIPGENLNHSLKLTFGLLFAWIGYLLVGVLMGVTSPMKLEGVSCIFIIGVGSVLPLMLLYREAKKGVILKANLTSALIAFSAALIGVLGVEAHCEWESAAHHLLFHFLPLVAITSGGIFMGRFLKDDKQK